MEPRRLTGPQVLASLSAADQVCEQLAILAALQAERGELLIPEGDVAHPEISIVIPAINDELTIAELVGWCKEGLANAGVAGEILIVDRSTDSTAKKAVASGARVLRVECGLGRACVDAIPYIRGKYVLLGDAGLTYDFRDIEPFIEKFREGHEFIMGSRFKGQIEEGAMPALHRYFGTPLTNWILNFLYSADFSDIHCGMRGITRDALIRMDIQSQSWEYASEMVLKSVQMELDRAEVPVRFWKDREGSMSHHRRMGPTSPWIAAWINLRSMCVYGAEFFALRPGLMLLALGILLTLPLSLGPVSIKGYVFSRYWMLLGMLLSIAGLQTFQLGCLSQMFHDYSGRVRRRWLRMFSYNRSVVASGFLVLGGIGLVLPLSLEYHRDGFMLSGLPGRPEHLAILGLLLMICGFSNFVFTLVLHAAALSIKIRGSAGG